MVTARAGEVPSWLLAFNRVPRIGARVPDDSPACGRAEGRPRAAGSRHQLPGAATLSGSGTIHGAVESSGGIVSPGSSAGRLTVDGFEPEPGQTFTVVEAVAVSGGFDDEESWLAPDCAVRATSGSGLRIDSSPTSVTLTIEEAADGVFCDNFESGDTLAWSAAEP